MVSFVLETISETTTPLELLLVAQRRECRFVLCCMLPYEGVFIPLRKNGGNLGGAIINHYVAVFVGHFDACSRKKEWRKMKGGNRAYERSYTAPQRTTRCFSRKLSASAGVHYVRRFLMLYIESRSPSHWIYPFKKVGNTMRLGALNCEPIHPADLLTCPGCGKTSSTLPQDSSTGCIEFLTMFGSAR